MKTMLLSLVFAGTGMLLAPATSRSALPQDPMPSTMVTTPTITPFLWFDDDAEQAIELRASWRCSAIPTPRRRAASPQRC